MAAKPPPQVTAQNEIDAWNLRRKCWTEERIAEEIGVHVSTVSRMLKRREAKLLKEFKDRAEEIKAEQTAQLQYIADEAMQAWERSKLNAEMQRTVAKKLGSKPDKDGKAAATPGGAEVSGMYLGGDGEEVDSETAAEMLTRQVLAKATGDGLTLLEETTTSESRGQSGDPRFLDAAMKAKAEIREIWGANAPKATKAEVSGPGGSPLIITTIEAVRPATLQDSGPDGDNG